jgi:hypothetical protein
MNRFVNISEMFQSMFQPSQNWDFSAPFQSTPSFASSLFETNLQPQSTPNQFQTPPTSQFHWPGLSQTPNYTETRHLFAGESRSERSRDSIDQITVKLLTSIAGYDLETDRDLSGIASRVLVLRHILDVPSGILFQIRPKSWVKELVHHLDLEQLRWIHSQLGIDPGDGELFYWRAVSGKHFVTATWLLENIPNMKDHHRLALYVSAYLGSSESIAWLESRCRFPAVDWKVAALFAIINRQNDCLRSLLSKNDPRSSQEAFRAALLADDPDGLQLVASHFSLSPQQVILPKRYPLSKRIVQWLFQDFGLAQKRNLEVAMDSAQPEAVRWLMTRSRFQFRNRSLDELSRHYRVEVTPQTEQTDCLVCGDGLDRWAVVKCCGKAFCLDCLEECWTTLPGCPHCRSERKELASFALKTSGQL